MLYVVLWLMFLSFAGGGFLIRELKAYDLIAGYNTMPTEEKAQYDIASLGNRLGLLLYFCAVLTASVIVLFYFGHFSLAMKDLIMLCYVAIVMFIPGIAMLIFNKKNIRKVIPIFIIYNVITAASLTAAFLKVLRNLI